MFFKYWHPHILITIGVKQLAEENKAWWLVDVIASYYGTQRMEEAMEKDFRLKDMQFWKLMVDRENNTATLTMRADDGVPPAITQEIEFTDYPEPEANIWCGPNFDQEGELYWTLYLPSEH